MTRTGLLDKKDASINKSATPVPMATKLPFGPVPIDFINNTYGSQRGAQCIEGSIDEINRYIKKRHYQNSAFYF